jgi:hypothetical protein
MNEVNEAFLLGQMLEIDTLCKLSDRLYASPNEFSEGGAPKSYIFRLTCRSPARVDGVIHISEREHLICVAIPDDYLQIAHDPGHILCLLEPRTLFHPNIMGPMICIGDISPATAVVDILVRTFEVLTCQRINMREEEALNYAACEWARHATLPLETDSVMKLSVKPRSDFTFTSVIEEV